MTDLAELISLDAIVLDQQVADWEEAVRASGRLLEETGVAGADYTQSMVDSLHENGPYIVVAPGFAFAHARPSESVRRTGMSWVRLAEPVEFGHTSNDPVSLVVALAATDSTTHREAMASLATLIGRPETKAALDAATSPEEVHEILRGRESPPGPAAQEAPAQEGARPAVQGKQDQHRIMTVCGNGLGTSLFLKNTLEQVLQQWGWSQFVTVEATDTVSARGKSKDVDLIFTSGEIARTLGDVGVPVRVIENFTSTTEIDSALRESYDL